MAPKPVIFAQPPVAHIDEPDTVNALLNALRTLHGPPYEFAVGRWAGEVRMVAPMGRTLYRFLLQTSTAMLLLQAGDRVRGATGGLPLEPIDESVAQVTAAHAAPLWPGDVITATSEPVILQGSGVYFDVIAETTAYPTPRAVFLRKLPDHPGGCAAYPGAFRREALPPVRPPSAAPDRCGVNRVNEHTLDMRLDRQPSPIAHYHGPLPLADGTLVNHSEIALVLPRAVYGLPEVAQPDAGQVRIYRRPAEDPTDTVVIPVRPGSLVVTPATPFQTMGHCFENCFALLVAIPGFVAPYQPIGAETKTARR
ncbi:MAG: hypothetical protein KF832_15940 [Caldilineaceae bacterium]|nr:hypothetical protein [Caldilineaceae bacterium]